MNPALIPLIPSLIKGVVEIITDRKAFVENLKSKTTKAAVAVAAAGAGSELIIPETEEAALTQLVSGIVAAALFFYRKSRA
ncbi:MAG: hypothetical protein ACN2B6_12310 [Rickettsiales bacterium]